MDKKVLSLLLGTSVVQAQLPVLNACASNEYRFPDGSCNKCYEGTIPDANQVLCLPVGFCQLVTNQINLPNGQCQECPICEVRNQAMNGCDKPSNFNTCINNAAKGTPPPTPVAPPPAPPVPTWNPPASTPPVPTWNPPASASPVPTWNPNAPASTPAAPLDCDKCYVPDLNQQTCIQAPDFNHCMKTACNWETDIIDRNGDCKACGNCEKPSWDRSTCFQDVNYHKCMNSQVLATPSTPPLTNGLHCTSKQILLATGLCSDCPICTNPNTSQTQCEQVTPFNTCMNTACDWNTQIIQKDQCFTCANGETSNFFKNQCVQAKGQTPPPPPSTNYAPPAPAATAPLTCGPGFTLDAWGMSCVQMTYQQPPPPSTWQAPPPQQAPSTPTWQPPPPQQAPFQPTWQPPPPQNPQQAPFQSSWQTPPPQQAPSPPTWQTPPPQPPVQSQPSVWQQPATTAPPNCTSGEVLASTGQCQQCPSGSVPDKTQSFCQTIAYSYVNFADGGQEGCPNDQYLKDGECFDCQNGFVQNSQGDACSPLGFYYFANTKNHEKEADAEAKAETEEATAEVEEETPQEEQP